MVILMLQILVVLLSLLCIFDFWIPGVHSSCTCLSVFLYCFLSIINREIYFVDSEATDSPSDDEIENKVGKFLVAGTNSQ